MLSPIFKYDLTALIELVDVMARPADYITALDEVMYEYTKYLLNDEGICGPYPDVADHLFFLRCIKQAFEAMVKKESEE